MKTDNQKGGAGSSLKFRLTVDDDGWPPVASESIPVTLQDDGVFRVTVPPFFLKDVSVGDRIRVKLDCEDYVTGWTHTFRSGRTTIWLLRGDAADLGPHLESLKALKCNVERFSEIGLCAVDVPESVDMSEVDKITSRIRADGGHVAYPSLRH